MIFSNQIFKFLQNVGPVGQNPKRLWLPYPRVLGEEFSVVKCESFLPLPLSSGGLKAQFSKLNFSGMNFQNSADLKVIKWSRQAKGLYDITKLNSKKHELDYVWHGPFGLPCTALIANNMDTIQKYFFLKLQLGLTIYLNCFHYSDAVKLGRIGEAPMVTEPPHTCNSFCRVAPLVTIVSP